MLHSWPLECSRAQIRRVAVRAEHERLKAGPWQGFAGYDGWFVRLNNAALAVQGAYDDLVPAFERIFDEQGRDFARFHAAVRQLAALPRAERRARLLAEPLMRPSARSPHNRTGGGQPCPT